MKCPDCGEEMWDNREGKKNPKAPDFKCKDKECGGVIWPPRPDKQQQKEQPKSMKSKVMEPESDDMTEARKHLMRSANLYNLCVDCVEKSVWPHLVKYSQKDHSDWLTCDLYQAAIATLYIEASRSGCIAKMPERPLK